jgi:hypothetical protein
VGGGGAAGGDHRRRVPLARCAAPHAQDGAAAVAVAAAPARGDCLLSPRPR